MNDRLRIVDIAKKFAMWFMAAYFITLMIFSFRTEYVRISNTLFIMFAGMVGLYRMVNLEVKRSNFYYYIFGILLLSVMSYYWAPAKNIVINTTRTYFYLTILAIAIINIIETPEDLTYALKALGIAGVVMCIYTVFTYGFDTFINLMKEGERLGAEVNHENTFGTFCTISFAILITTAIFEKKALYYVLSAIPFIFSFTSGSRKVIIGIIIVFAIIIILNTNSKKIISSVIIATVVIYIVSLMANSIYFANIFERFEQFENLFNGSGKRADGSTRLRFEMIRLGLQWFIEKPVFGHGTYQYNYLFNLIYGYNTYSHNFYIQQLVSFGIVGFSMFIGMYYEIFKNVIKFVKKDTNAKIILIFVTIMVINGFAMEYSTSKLYFILLGFGFSFINVYKKSYKIRGVTPVKEPKKRR